MSVEPQDRFPNPRPVPEPAQPFRVADRLVHPSLNRVETPEGTVSLEPKVMRVLLCLARRPGAVVTKEELFRDVWDGAYVTDDVLTRAVGELRRLFGDQPDQPRVIETIRKSGYRLIAPVLPAAPAATSPSASASAPSTVPARPLGTRTAAVALLVLAAGLALLLLARGRRESSPAMRVRPLIALPGIERDPSVSPDGSRVAFAWNGGAGDGLSLYVQLTDGEKPLRLTSTPDAEDRAPAWSPDGQRLAFTRLTASDCRIVVVSALGGEERPLAPCADRDYHHLSWSPDGRWLARARRDPGSPLAIELLSPETLERRPLTHPPAGMLGDSSPEFSPDGRTLAFTRNLTDGVNDVYRVPVEGGEPTRLTFDDRDTMGSAWSGDGQSVVFSSSRAGIYSLWRVPARGGEPAWVAGGGTKMKHPSAARGRRLLAFENWIYEVNLWRIPAGPGAAAAPLALTSAADEWNFEPNLSPDGRRVAFVSTRSGSEEIWVVGSGGADARRLTSFRGARLETPRWSPDGRRLVFSARVPARADLYLVGAEGGVAERLNAESSDAIAPSWSRDGRSVYFASRRETGSWKVWRLALEGRRAVPVTAAGGYAAQESPDGQWLYFTRADAPGIWRQSAAASDGVPAERVTDRLAPEDWSNWVAAERGLYFRELCARHPGPGVAFLAYGAREPVDLAPLPEQGMSGLAVSGDGAWIIYPRIDRHSCDIRVIENPAS